LLRNCVHPPPPKFIEPDGVIAASTPANPFQAPLLTLEAEDHAIDRSRSRRSKTIVEGENRLRELIFATIMTSGAARAQQSEPHGFPIS
jgi:hypothetical protein